MPRPRSDNSQTLHTVERAISVLKTLARSGREMGVTEIANALDVYPSVISRLLATLRKDRLVRQNPQTLKYQLGMGILELSAAVIDSIDLTSIARPALGELNRMTSETVFLMVIDGTDGVNLMRIDSPHGVVTKARVGGREPLHTSAVGKALLAHLHVEEVDHILQERGLPPSTPNTITDPAVFREHLKMIRQQGYAIDDEEGEIGVRCIAAPVFNYLEEPVAAISISAPAFRTPVEKLISWSPLLLEKAAEISQQLGYRRRDMA